MGNRFLFLTMIFCFCATVFVNATLAQTVDVYVGGGTDEKAAIWKNGEILYTLTEGYSDAHVKSIYVYDGDVYAVGQDVNYDGVVWKNDEILHVPSDELYTTNQQSIFVFNGDVYTGGCLRDRVTGEDFPAIWKNGEILYAFSLQLDEVAWVYVSDGDVYATANKKVWRNGEILYDFSETGYPFSIYVSGDDVYVAGSTKAYDDLGNMKWHSTVWKNGEILYLSEETGTSGALCITDNDIYVIVDATTILKNWEILYTFPNTYGIADVYVIGDDVYIAGSDRSIACYWKNGEEIPMEGDHAMGMSIFVVDNSVGVSELPKAEMKLYPNPTTDQFQIVSDELLNGDVEIYDIAGKCVQTSPITNQSQEFTMDISKLPAGTYLVKIITDSGVLVEKVIKN